MFLIYFKIAFTYFNKQLNTSLNCLNSQTVLGFFCSSDFDRATIAVITIVAATTTYNRCDQLNYLKLIFDLTINFKHSAYIFCKSDCGFHFQPCCTLRFPLQHVLSFCCISDSSTTAVTTKAAGTTTETTGKKFCLLSINAKTLLFAYML